MDGQHANQVVWLHARQLQRSKQAIHFGSRTSIILSAADARYPSPHSTGSVFPQRKRYKSRPWGSCVASEEALQVEALGILCCLRGSVTSCGLRGSVFGPGGAVPVLLVVVLNLIKTRHSVGFWTKQVEYKHGRSGFLHLAAKYSAHSEANCVEILLFLAETEGITHITPNDFRFKGETP